MISHDISHSILNVSHIISNYSSMFYVPYSLQYSIAPYPPDSCTIAAPYYQCLATINWSQSIVRSVDFSHSRLQHFSQVIMTTDWKRILSEDRISSFRLHEIFAYFEDYPLCSDRGFSWQELVTLTRKKSDVCPSTHLCHHQSHQHHQWLPHGDP